MKDFELFTKETQGIVYGYQINAVQGMLDFDYLCQREVPSVAAIVRPTQSPTVVKQKVFWGFKEIVIPVYRTLETALKNHINADVLINFASYRSAFQTTKLALSADTIRTVVIIAEGVPERQSRELIKLAEEKKKIIIGPATVGGIKAGAFRIGNTGGTVENIKLSKLYRPGSIGFVSKSGGMSNEMYFQISQNTDGVNEGISIGGDKYPGSKLIDHILRFEKNPDIKMIVCLGELGGHDEYDIVDAVRESTVKKPIVMWVTGISAKILPQGIQFGHAGAMADSEGETADAKNRALAGVGVIVPDSFDDFSDKIRETFETLREKGVIKEREEIEPPNMPMDFDEALKLGMVRRPTSITSSISDDREETLTYNRIPIDEIIKNGKSLGYVIGLLWFKRELPEFAQEYIELILKIAADHGPAVAGAHNAIVAARAGKDLMASLSSGLLTIGPRFGGAISDTAKYFRDAIKSGKSPQEFIEYMKNEIGMNIPGIGHRVKSIQNPDTRVELIIDFVTESFLVHPNLDYAIEVEKLTTSKRNNLILNVDGCIGVSFLDLMLNLGLTDEEMTEVIEAEVLNGLFVLGRSIGIMGHIFDQKRQQAGLYRQPYDEILYLDE